MSKFSKDLLESLQQAVDYSKGKKVPGMRVTVVEVEVPDVKAVRRSRSTRRARTYKKKMA